ncbi:unannotated protein [freshwater metagenome]|uniref:Unannotated protein n=1 Tax=freshwater metagenome TaxID=449393 RepID=A0A6J7JN92_9ZZZZ
MVVGHERGIHRVEYELLGVADEWESLHGLGRHVKRGCEKRADLLGDACGVCRVGHFVAMDQRDRGRIGRDREAERDSRVVGHGAARLDHGGIGIEMDEDRWTRRVRTCARVAARQVPQEGAALGDVLALGGDLRPHVIERGAGPDVDLGDGSVGEGRKRGCCGTGARGVQAHHRVCGTTEAGQPHGQCGDHVVDARARRWREVDGAPRGVGRRERHAWDRGGFEACEAIEPEGLAAGELRVGGGERCDERGARTRELVACAKPATRDHVAYAGEGTRWRGHLDEEQVAIACGDADALLVDSHDGAAGRAVGGVEHQRLLEHVHVVVEDHAHRTEGVAIARAERDGAPRAIGERRGCDRVEDRSGSGELAEHAMFAHGLRRGFERAVRELGGDSGKAARTGLVATGVERERRVVGEDGHRLGGDDLATVDIGGHDVPGDGVLSLAAEDAPRGRVQPGVAGKWTIVEVDVRRSERKDCVGEHAEVGHAQQHVELVLGERGREVARGVDARDAVPLGVLLHLRVVGGDDDHRQPVLAGDLGALGGQRLVTDEGAAPR